MLDEKSMTPMMNSNTVPNRNISLRPNRVAFSILWMLVISMTLLRSELVRKLCEILGSSPKKGDEPAMGAQDAWI